MGVLLRIFFVFILFLLLMGSFVFAEDAQIIDGGFSLDVEISSASFDLESRELVLTLIIKNKTSDFLDDLEFNVALFKGEELNMQGSVFEGMEYMTRGEGKVDSIAPNETIVFEAKYIPPQKIDSGKYFMDLFILNKQGLPLGAEFTRNAVFLFGSGGFVPALRGYAVTPNGYDSLLFGWYVEKEYSPKIVIPFNENLKFAEKIKNEKVFMNAKVMSINNENKVVKEYDLIQVSPTIDQEKGEAIVYELVPGEWTVPGPYDVEISFFDSQGNEFVKNIYARWLVDGFFARVENINSQTNSYSALDSVDLKVAVVSWVPQGSEKVGVEVKLIGDSKGLDKSFSLNKEISVDSQETIVADFSDSLVPFEFKTKEIVVTLTDSLGEILDTKTFDVKNLQETIVGGVLVVPKGIDTNQPVGDNKTRDVSINGIMILILIILIIIVMGGILLVKTKKIKVNK